MTYVVDLTYFLNKGKMTYKPLKKFWKKKKKSFPKKKKKFGKQKK